MAAPAWESKGADFSDTSAAPSFAVPSGTASGKVAIVSFFINVAATLVTGVPAGFAAVPGTPVIGGNNKTAKYWKRLTDVDSGTYDFVLDSAQFDTISVGPDRLIIHTGTNWAGGTWTPNAGYTKRLQPPVGLISTSDKVQSSAGTTGSISAESTNSDKRTAHIIALIGTTIAGGSMQTISDEARANLLANRTLSDPQPLSNVDLMKLVLDDGAQVLIPKTNATVAEHYNRYLITLRDT